MVGKLERIPLREVWKHEAHNFTTWLRDEIDVLAELLEMPLADAENEHSAGDFSVDIIAQDEEGNPVIIENQLEKSDHDHLGKLITYLTAIEAVAAVWMVAEPRPEHVKAITWLNEFAPVSFYLIKVEAVRIGDSEPAPLMTLIVGPSDEAKSAGTTRKEMKERERLRQAFWAGLLEKAAGRTQLHGNVSPKPYPTLSTGAGMQGLTFNYGITQHGASVGLYIDRGKDKDQETEDIYRQFEARRAEIDETYGQPLRWEQLPEKRASWIGMYFKNGGYRDDKASWTEIQDEMIDAMIRLEKALRPYLDALEV